MPHWDHMSDMAEDLAFVNAIEQGDPARKQRYLRRRILAVAFIPVFLAVLYLVALVANGKL